jgi:hypothetical protein
MSRLAGFEKTSTGIVIGRSHIPRPPRDLGYEGERIQAALLHKPAPLAERLLDAFNNNAMPVFFSICIGGTAWGVAKKFLG